MPCRLLEHGRILDAGQGSRAQGLLAAAASHVRKDLQVAAASELGLAFGQGLGTATGQELPVAGTRGLPHQRVRVLLGAGPQPGEILQPLDGRRPHPGVRILRQQPAKRLPGVPLRIEAGDGGAPGRRVTVTQARASQAGQAHGTTPVI
ncbi:hypothetical protein DEM34_04935 [Spiribacter halobius]|uniref:Uncharacterized protein n=1 Tax=Sediminicurvatus halobius TaxID=2182432 RepID=A0A2U2N6R1_9GAMM|nr:hypothetical protein DEM34_04935 [Spiribacter halobius]